MGVKKCGKKTTIKVYVDGAHLGKIKAKAKKAGINYKMMMADILHKYANNQLHENFGK